MFLSHFSHPRDDQLSLWVGANWGAQSASWNKKSGCNGRYEDIVQVNYHAQVTADPVVFVLVLYHVIVRNAFYNSCWEMTQSSTDDSSCVRAAVLLRFFLLFYSLNLMLWDVYWEHKKKMLFSETRVACKFSLSFIKEQRSPRHCCLHYDIPYNYYLQWNETYNTESEKQKTEAVRQLCLWPVLMLFASLGAITKF